MALVAGSPQGAVTAIAHTAPQTYAVSGWAADPNTTAALSLRLTVDGTSAAWVWANRATPAVPAGYPGYGRPHGFTVNVNNFPYGRHTLCVVAHNVGAGADTTFGCRVIDLDTSPRGTVVLRQAPGGVTVSGQAYDTSAPSTPIYVDVTDNGRDLGTVYANTTAYQPFGYQKTYLLPAGSHTICVTGINVGWGWNRRFACQAITLNYNPTAAVTGITQSPSGVRMVGSASDPDTGAPVDVVLSVDGATTGRITADYGSNGHGFVGWIRAGQGTHTFCAYAVNVAYGNANSPKACRTFSLNYNPTAAITGIAQSTGGVRMTGWASDPNTSNPVTVVFSLDGATVGQGVANYGSDGHGFVGWIRAGQGTHTFCVYAVNLGLGTANSPQVCRSLALDFNPTVAVTGITQSTNGVRMTGWASDPNTSNPVTVVLSVDGTTTGQIVANASSSVAPGHGFVGWIRAGQGTHTFCAYALNVGLGDADSPKACRTITLYFQPRGAFETAQRDTSNMPQIRVTGWALDPNTTKPIQVAASVDGGPAVTATAGIYRADVASQGYGAYHGFSFDVPADENEHKVCVTALNTSSGSNVSLGCKIVIAVHPAPPTAPGGVAAQAGYGGATITWQPPSSDGGAPWTGYTVTSSPAGGSVTVGATATSAVITGLKPSTAYTFSVVATNVAGASPAGVSPVVTTQSAPPAQTTPAPISTSRYVRNIGNATPTSSTDLATMRSEGATDAYYNPSGHGYLILLDIGGQDDYDGGVVLSATSKFVSYANLVNCIKAYVDGYASKQNASAPVVIAIGTNNDMEVTAAAGKSWADKVVDPVLAYAAKYPGMTIAGANDIEPGFRGTYSATRSWLQGYLAATSAPFVFNGSADGCSWTSTGASCNNGWSMSGLYSLAAGMAPTRILNLPQVYNNTMAAQWKYISLTGVATGSPRINFAGALTEWTACDQDGGCFSITGNQAWTQLWGQLQSDGRLKVGSLPYSTDLRIDR
jgi:hypothetical protein